MTNRFFRYAAICGTSFLLLFVFLFSSIRHHHPALLHRYTDPGTLVDISRGVFHSRFETFLFSVFPSIAVYPFLRQRPGITTRCLAVTQSLAAVVFVGAAD